MATMKKSTQVGLLIAALVVGALAAAATRTANKSSSSKRAHEALPELAAVTAKSEQAASTDSSLQGTVLETIQVQRYTYLRIGEKGQPGTWAAVTSAPNVKVGDSVQVVQAQPMVNFRSSALKRTFDKIYFGALAGNGAASGANPHAGIDMNNPHAGMKPGAAPNASGQALDANGVNLHAQGPAASETVPVGNVAKAKGELGHTVAEIYAKHAELAGKVIRVRAVVVKVTPGVMGKTFVHVRDGSGSEKTNDFDLTITTQEQPQLSDTLLFEGKLDVDVDFGAGYKYPVIIQDAKLVTD
jgi:hypothetical protein